MQNILMKYLYRSHLTELKIISQGRNIRLKQIQQCPANRLSMSSILWINLMPCPKLVGKSYLLWLKIMFKLKKVDVAEAPQLENFGSKIKGKSFPFPWPRGLKLQNPINPTVSVLEPGHIPNPRNSRLKIQFLPATATFLKNRFYHSISETPENVPDPENKNFQKLRKIFDDPLSG